MKISDLLRTLADKMDTKKENTPLSMSSAASKKDQTDPSELPDSTTTMVPPLQQKIEMLKKNSGVASAFKPSGKNHNDLENLKRMAGLSQSTIRRVSDENESA